MRARRRDSGVAVRLLALIATASLGLGCEAPLAAGTPKPPSQPAVGPGGAQYRHTRVAPSRHGAGATEVWLYEPADPKPAAAPVIVFLHGWSAMNPRSYGAWIEHVVKRGNIVVYPRYQADLRTPPREFVANAVAAVRSALRMLVVDAGRVRPELDHVAFVGHSAGGQLAANLAAVAASSGLPRPKAVMAVEPGKSQNRWERAVIPLEDLSKIASDTLLLVLVGDRDRLAGDHDARRIYTESTAVPAADKDYVAVVSDEHGSPPLIANHFAPCAGDAEYDSHAHAGGAEPSAGWLRRRVRTRLAARAVAARDAQGASRTSVDALDYYGYWKLFDALCESAFYGRNRRYALGNTPEQRYMGRWSDGAPVEELRVGLSR